MSSELTQIVGYGNDILAFKYYGVATITIFFYEYFLMLPDEIQYARSPKKTWAFYLFLLNRYVPMAFPFWFLAVSFRQDYSQELCNKTSFISILTLVLSTLIAQVVLTLRIYAVTGKSRLIAAGFSIITASQLAAGIYLTLPVPVPESTVPQIPFDSFKLCILSRYRGGEIAYPVISLAYDLLAFLTILRQAGRSTVRRFGMPGLLGTIVRDTTKYFFVIFTAHFVLTMTLLLGRPAVRLLPAPGNIVYIPIMITRLMISLRNAARSQGLPWSAGESGVDCGLDNEMHTLQFATNRGALDQRDGDGPLSPISTGV